ncbi:mariner Mos1 transposase [Caerostris extrusa]|uniref:Mariner Mos1 transposase n=1 Tax=Caerostris extrusa TaxID=172846 RepID=A0AAV4MWB0_CAEEX|nr:mariner Mos1 transposase [Caerostris extrusa]
MIFLTTLIFCYHLTKSSVELHRMLVESYGELALGKSQYFEWFKNAKVATLSGRNEERGKLPKSLRTANCKHGWMRIKLKCNNISQIN